MRPGMVISARVGVAKLAAKAVEEVRQLRPFGVDRKELNAPARRERHSTGAAVFESPKSGDDTPNRQPTPFR